MSPFVFLPSFAAFLVLIASILLTLLFRPYQQSEDTAFEVLSFSVLLLTFFGALIVAGNTLSSSQKELASWSILVMNMFVFLVALAVKIRARRRATRKEVQ